MEKVLYPAIFHKEEDGKGYWVEFPDIDGCVTGGDNLEEAFLMAGDALNTFLVDKERLPKATPIENIQRTADNIVMLVYPKMYVSNSAKQYIIQETLEQALAQKQYNKNQIAKILNVDRAYIGRIVSGERTPPLDMAQRIGLLLGIDPNIFYQESDC